MPDLRPLLRPLRNAVRRLRARRALARAAATAGPHAEPLLRALLDAAQGHATTGARTWFARVEALRERLRDSREEVSFLDFGAVDPELDLAPAEMAAGLRVTRPVRELAEAGKAPFWGALLYRVVRAQAP